MPKKPKAGSGTTSRAAFSGSPHTGKTYSFGGGKRKKTNAYSRLRPTRVEESNPAARREPETSEEDMRLQHELDEAAAQLRVVVDKRLGRTTPERVKKLALGYR